MRILLGRIKWKLLGWVGINRRYPSETSRVRELVRPYCLGYGCDIGFGGDKIMKQNCVGIDFAHPYANTGDDAVDIAVDLFEEKIPVRDNTFDYVYSSHLIEDFVDTKAMLEEFIRILKSGGYLILVFPDQHKYEESCKRSGYKPNGHHVHKHMGAIYMKGQISNIQGIDYTVRYVSDRIIDYNVVMVWEINKLNGSAFS